MNFFITGLPRSRTSWLANFFTYKGCYCFHELGKYGKDYMQLYDILRKKADDYVGTADSMAPFYFEALTEMSNNKFRLVVIDRDPEDAYQSFLKSFRFEDSIEYRERFSALQLLTENLIGKFNPMIVKFEDLNDMQTMKNMWYHCCPELLFDEDRFKLLNELKVEPYIEKYMANVNMDNVYSIIGG